MKFDGGRIDQADVAWQVDMSGPRNTMIVAFRGTLTGDQISGEVKFGSFGEGSFLATRSRE